LRFFRIVVLLTLLVAFSAACSSQPTTSASQPDQSQSDSGAVTQNTAIPDNSAAASGDVVATVNGVAISRTSYDRALQRAQAITSVADQAALRRQVLETLIEQELISQAAPELGVTVTDEEVQAEIEALRELADSEDEWQEFLDLNGYTEEEMFAAQRDLLTTQRVRDALMEPFSGDVLQVNARHIVVRTLAEAEEVLDRLEQGEGFATLAAEYSIDSTTREFGGNLGWFARDELLQPELERVAFELEPGQMAGPVQSSLGYHILQTMDKAERPVEPERLSLLSEGVFNNWLQDLRSSAAIERFI
jgi:foldase protein PrsA